MKIAKFHGEAREYEKNISCKAFWLEVYLEFGLQLVPIKMAEKPLNKLAPKEWSPYSIKIGALLNFTTVYGISLH